jgi:hypothetical protein
VRKACVVAICTSEEDHSDVPKMNRTNSFFSPAMGVAKIRALSILPGNPHSLTRFSAEAEGFIRTCRGSFPGICIVFDDSLVFSVTQSESYVRVQPIETIAEIGCHRF